MKKITKGFTLVELIAVITLLSAIILVSVPVIINTLNKTKEKEYNEFKKVIEHAAELYLERNRYLFPELNEIGNAIEINAELLINEGYLKNDLVDPIDNNPVSKYKVVATYEQNEVISYQAVERKTFAELVTTNDEVANINACALSGNCELGTKFAIEVNETDTYNFYVIADNGEEVTLIMDRNLGNKVAWYKDNDDTTNNELNNLGPITLLNYLNSQINSEEETWINIAAIKSYKYDENVSGAANQYGFKSLEITNGTGVLTGQDGIITKLKGMMRARILTYEEYIALKTKNSNISPTWLYSNLSLANTPQAPYGYWLLLTNPDNFYYGTYMNYAGTHGSYNVSNDEYCGARPVITVSRSL